MTNAKGKGGQANVLFVNPSLTNQPHPCLGLLTLATILKKKGHRIKVYDTTFGYSASELISSIKSFSPDAIAFSVMSTNYHLALDIAKDVKKEVNVPIIFGGPHSTLAPEETASEKAIDFVCVGEGDDALPELIECIKKGKSCKRIKNIWGKGFSNPVRDLKQDLDSVPFIDWSLLDKRYFRKAFFLSLITARGCPFQCTYCANHAFRKTFAGKGKYIRYMSPRRVINEIKEARKKIHFESVKFSDDTFTLVKSRVEEFCKLFKKEIGLPFGIMSRADCVDYDLLKTLREAGCNSIGIGIESGNDVIRNNVMKRNMSKACIINAFTNARKLGIKTYAFNIVGFPFETEENIFETIELNRLCNPHSIQVSIFSPYVGTEAKRICEDNNFIKQEPGIDYYTSTVLSQPSISKAKVESLHKTFHLYCFLPKQTFFLINAIRFVLEKTPDRQRGLVGLPVLKLGELMGSIRRKGIKGASDAVLFRSKTQILKKIKK